MLKIKIFLMLSGILLSVCMSSLKFQKPTLSLKTPTYISLSYAKISEEQLYTMANLIVKGSIVAIDSPTLNLDETEPPNRETNSNDTTNFPFSEKNFYMPVWKITISVEKVYLGTGNKKISIFIPGEIEDLSVGDRGTWFINTNALIVWHGKAKKYWKTLPMLVGGALQGRGVFNSDVAEKYRFQRENFHLKSMQKAKENINLDRTK